MFRPRLQGWFGVTVQGGSHRDAKARARTAVRKLGYSTRNINPFLDQTVPLDEATALRNKVDPVHIPANQVTVEHYAEAGKLIRAADTPNYMILLSFLTEVSFFGRAFLGANVPKMSPDAQPLHL